MTPQERIYKNRDLIDLIIKNEYLPQISNAQFGEIVKALKELNPSARYEPGCNGCIMDIVRVANIYRNEYEASLVKQIDGGSKFHKFPKSKK